ncbi:Serine/threonine-protein kinase StkP [Nonomuraea coxensis DSM 45129]|uniref:Serine/threonine-protein kinase StkP n=1 Tax=Nonomuraea coxensis DSM 45129 TaxID=1122611 RepID=A0ABX8UBU1_9ACTN|nr:lipopolysaccharide kinase InaA family protein [Nonomuraea coxensis]QYC45233.1 Serine/threonine-protein kinase StkP [Nonomuraea coxensis DSM 45129]
MRAGQLIRGYRITSEPTNSGGGRCMWAFAERGRHEYFIKRFLDPKRPKPGATASAAGVRLRLEVCEEFERRHRAMMERLPRDAPGGGNLVLALDFFLEGVTYYKVTERVHALPLPRPQALTAGEKAVLLRTLGLSVRLLHRIGVVHGDLKPGNVLVGRRRPGAFYTAKLIDFDDAYVSGSPPAREDITGDSVYAAPEWRRYVQGDAGMRPEWLTTKTDVFALGLMTHVYLTGSLPGFDDRFGSPADAVLAGAELRVDDRLAEPMRALLSAMTSRTPMARPGMTIFLEMLKDSRMCELRSRSVTSPGSRVRISMRTKENHS